MNRECIAVSIVVLAASLANAAPPKKACAANLSACPNAGCGSDFDPNLNERKNITSDAQSATPRTLQFMQGLGNPQGFSKGNPRTKLTNLGEGQKLVVVAYLIAAKEEGGESCNCALTGLKNNDNHLVLVTKPTIAKTTMATREAKSTTMEITPRVRFAHPSWTKSNLDPMIRTSPKKALLVRVTGLLMFDSEHFLGKHLVRVNDWELHPILNLEYCTKLYTCKPDSAVGWRPLDNL